MIDAHVHLEGGPYTSEWVDRFIDQALKTGIDELRLLEHSHRFIEFKDLYRDAAAYSEYQAAWFGKKKLINLREYLDFVDAQRQRYFPIKVIFGMEICHLPATADIIAAQCLRDHLDFLTGSVHFLDSWGFDHKKEHWEGRDVDTLWNHYYELMLDCVSSGLYDVIAHPDSIKCFGFYPTTDLTPRWEAVAAAARYAGVALEQSAGLRNNYSHEEVGMNRRFLEILLHRGVDIVTASDAHKPEDVGRNIKEAADLVRTAALNEASVAEADAPASKENQ